MSSIPFQDTFGQIVQVQSKVGEYRVEASKQQLTGMNCKAYLTSNHHVIVMVLEVWYVCFDFTAYSDDSIIRPGR